MKNKIFYFWSLVNLFTFTLSAEESVDKQILSNLSQTKSEENSIIDLQEACTKEMSLASFFGFQKDTRPNILFLMVDEQRYPTIYETEELKEWKKKNLVFQTMLEEKGYTFHNHYTNTNACSPARTTLQTGHYPNVHGVTQTDGIAKTAYDPEMTWLAPYTVPTIGNYLREAGYKTILKGKWHVSDSAIRLNDGSYMTTFDGDGNPIPEAYQFYLEKNVLDAYGYDGWIGPEPHGSAPLNSGSSVNSNQSGRDVKYTQELIEELSKLSKESNPWLLMAPYVNPHDITVYGLYSTASQVLGSDWDFPIDETLPKKLFTDEFALSLNETLEDKPPTQLSYRDIYPIAIQPIEDLDRFQRYYYTLQKKADENMMQVWNQLVTTNMHQNTIVILTSDHGELLGSHGRMFQKWYQAYQETIHVPFVVYSPLFPEAPQNIYDLTSHVDILPTLLDFAKTDKEVLRQKLGKKFSLNLPLPGRSLYPIIKNPQADRELKFAYFYTEDNPIKGLNPVNSICKVFKPVIEPSSVEAVLTYVGEDLWKFTHYYSIYGRCAYDTLATNTLYEMYNVTKDPLELNNLYGNEDYNEIQKDLLNLLYQKAVLYRSVEPDLTL